MRAIAWLCLSLTAAAISGCWFQPFDPNGHACASQSDCLTGYRCEANVCVAGEPLDGGMDADLDASEPADARPDATHDAPIVPDAPMDAVAIDAISLDAFSLDAGPDAPSTGDAALEAGARDAGDASAIDAASTDDAGDASSTGDGSLDDGGTDAASVEDGGADAR
jgi:hypothetical protein